MANKTISLALEEYECVDIDALATEEGELGSGFLGTVRLCYHLSHGLIAAKCFEVSGGILDKRNIQASIKSEYSVLQEASHDNIVRVYGWCKWPNSMALLMEYMPGGSLRTIVGNIKIVLRPGLQLRMIQEISSALAFIHNPNGELRLVHGDIKPENILITPDFHCKVADFGSARLSQVTGAATVAVPKTRNRTKFTLLYAAPELLQNPSMKPAKEQDVYSFAMVEFVVMTKQPLIFLDEVKHRENCIRGERPDTKVISDKMATMEPGQREVVKTLKDWMERCWHHNPEERPSMTEVRDDLIRLLAKQKHSQIANEVALATKFLDAPSPVILPENSQKLHKFDTRSRTFEGTVRAPPPSQPAMRVAQAPVSDRLPAPQNPQPTADSGEVLFSDLTVSGGNEPSYSCQGFLDDVITPERPIATKKVQKKSATSPVSPASAPTPAMPPSAPALVGGEPPLTGAATSPNRGNPSRVTLDQLFLGGQNNEAQTLLKSFTDSLEHGRFNEARKIVDKVLAVVREQTSTKESKLKGFANRHRNEGKHLAALLYYDLAQAYFEHPHNHRNTYTGIEMYFDEVCAMAGQVMLADREFVKVVKGYVVPRMRVLRELLRGLPQIPGTERALEEAKCLRLLARTERLAGDSRQAKSHLEEAANIVKKDHGKEHSFYAELSLEARSGL